MRPHGRLRDKFRGALLGLAVGDGIGELVLRISHGQIPLKGMPRPTDPGSLEECVMAVDTLEYTDDTAMAIGLAESILAKKGLDPEHLGARFHANHDREPGRGYGGIEGPIFFAVEKLGVSYAESARRVGEAMFGQGGSKGNGAATRVAPLALFYWDSRDLDSKADESALVTHTHPVGRDGATVIAAAVSEAVKTGCPAKLDTDRFCRRILESAKTVEMQERLALLGDLLRGEASAGEAADRLGGGAAAEDSVPFALFSFLSNSRSFEDCLFSAVLNGGDCDTLGAMAGAIAGAYLGESAIPARWSRKVENQDYLRALARWLWALKTGRRGRHTKGLEERIAAWTREIDGLSEEVLEELSPVEGEDDVGEE